MSPNTNMSNSDRAIANLKYALDCVYRGKLLQARSAISTALSLLKMQDPSSVDDEVLRLISGK
jgi:hypothetical protein